MIFNSSNPFLRNLSFGKSSLFSNNNKSNLFGNNKSSLFDNINDKKGNTNLLNNESKDSMILTFKE